MSYENKQMQYTQNIPLFQNFFDDHLLAYDDDIEVEPGSIIYVPAGGAHSFHTLTEDVAVLILWDGPYA